MKATQILHISLILFVTACSSEKFAERKVELQNLAGEDEALEDADQTVVTVDDAQGSSEENGTLTDGGDCSKMSGVALEQIKVNGSGKVENITAADVYSIKVRGDENVVNLELKGADVKAKIAGICLDIAGNQAQVKVNVLLQLGTVYIRSRGNQAKVLLTVAKDASIGNYKVDAAGNQPSLEVKGEGKYPCTAEVEKGKELAVTCVKAP